MSVSRWASPTFCCSTPDPKKTAEASPTFHMAVAGSPPMRHMADRGAEKGGDAAEAIPQPSTTAEAAVTVATRAVWIGRRAC